MKNKDKIIVAIAPMMDWTDRHCRYFHRAMTRRALLFTEMVVCDAIIHGDREALLSHHGCEHPLALQIGGSDPDKLHAAVAAAAPFGFDEINLNVGCPSDRVQSGAFGACLMKQPQLVGQCVAAMVAATDRPVSVKCRIGVDEQDPIIALDELADSVWRAGASRLWVHARKAWLSGLSPAENRSVPPLDYARVRRLKAENPQRFIGLNGGLQLPEAAMAEFGSGPRSMDGLMFGRSAYRNPAILREIDQLVDGSAEPVSFEEIIDAMETYAACHIQNGGRLHHITRHMIGLFHGLPGARRWRQIMSSEAVAHAAGPDIIRRAFSEVDGRPTSKAA